MDRNVVSDSTFFVGLVGLVLSPVGLQVVGKCTSVCLEVKVAGKMDGARSGHAGEYVRVMHC